MRLPVHHSPLRGACLLEVLKSLYDVCRHCVRQAALLFHCHIFGFSLVTRLGLVMCWVSCCSSLLRPGAQVLWTLLCAGIALLTPFIESIVRIPQIMWRFGRDASTSLNTPSFVAANEQLN